MKNVMFFCPYRNSDSFRISGKCHLQGHKGKLPAMLLDSPKKAQTKLTLFSILSEEAGELGLGFAGRLACDVTRDTSL